MIDNLKLLDARAWPGITAGMIEEHDTDGLQAASLPFRREVDLRPLRQVLDHAMSTISVPQRADGWLAPRIHSALRLTRFEASDRRLWAYLAVMLQEGREYAMWRFELSKLNEDKLRSRLFGVEYMQAIARLWWGAEFTRNGWDYSLCTPAFALQDIPNTWFGLNAFHHRPTAIGAVEFMATANKGGMLGSKQANALAKAMNHALTLVPLDALAPDRGTDSLAIREWIAEAAPSNLIDDDLPLGPDEESVSFESITAVKSLLARVSVDLALLGEEASGPE